MIKIKLVNFSKISHRLKSYPWRQTGRALKYLPQAISRLEKIIVLILFFFIVGIIIYIGFLTWINNTQAVADFGGEFREGIVGERKDVDKHISRLIYAGLTKMDLNQNIIGDIAENWEIKEDGKVYEFHLRPNFNSEDLAREIINQNIWKDINISTPQAQTITFTFKQPFSPFLYASTEPIFPYGPYRAAEEGKNEITFLARDDYYSGRPFLDKIIVKIFQSEEDLLKSARSGDLSGLALLKESNLDDFRALEMSLPRDLILFFNLSVKSLQDINVRKALKENTAPQKELNLRLVTSDNPKNQEIAKKIVEKWALNNVKITLDIKDNITLQKTTIPKRDYDLLLYSLDYGEDPDPYPFWHSSQIKEDGKNLSNFKNSKADKLLEEARQEFDFSRREEKYKEFQKILDAEMPMFVVEHQTLHYYISNKIKGIEKIVGCSETDRFLNVASWYLETKRVKK